MPCTYNIWHVARKSNSLYSRRLPYFTWSLMKVCEKWPFENLNIGNFAKWTEWPQPELKESDMKRPYIFKTRVPDFHPFRSTLSHFQIIAHFYDFPIESHAKIPKCHKIFKTWPNVKKSNSLYSTMAVNVPITFGWVHVKIIGRVAYWHFQPTWSCVQNRHIL